LRCETCKKQFTRPVRSNRLNCYECRPERRQSADSKIISANFGENQDQQGEIQDQEGKLTRLTRLRLEELDVLDTWQGAAALTLAELIDDGKGGGTGGAAGAIRAHREAMAVAEALSNVDDGDVIDLIFADQA